MAATSACRSLVSLWTLRSEQSAWQQCMNVWVGECYKGCKVFVWPVDEEDAVVGGGLGTLELAMEWKLDQPPNNLTGDYRCPLQPRGIKRSSQRCFIFAEGPVSDPRSVDARPSSVCTLWTCLCMHILYRTTDFRPGFCWSVRTPYFHSCTVTSNGNILLSWTDKFGIFGSFCVLRRI